MTKIQRYNTKHHMNYLKNSPENKDMLLVDYVICSKKYTLKFYFACPFKAIRFLNLSKTLGYRYKLHRTVHRYRYNDEACEPRTALVKNKYRDANIKTYADCFNLYNWE